MTEYLVYVADKLVRLFEFSTVKIIASVLVAIFSFLFGDIYLQGMIAVVMLMAFDTCFGVAATYKEGKPVTSRGFSRVIIKGLVYFSAISAAYFADLTIPFNFIQATMISFVGITEFISILENIGRLGYKTPEKLLNQLHEYQQTGKLR